MQRPDKVELVHRGRYAETARMAGHCNTGTVINEFHELTAIEGLVHITMER